MEDSDCHYCESKAELYCLACSINVCKKDRIKHLEECEEFDLKSYFMSINLKVSKDNIYKETS